MKNLSRLTPLACLLALGACTRSMDYSYTPNTYSTKAIAPTSIGVAELTDKRAWVEPGNDKSKSFFMSAGAWRFGLSHNQQDYAPIGKILQDILVEELNKAGFKASDVADNTQTPAQMASANHVAYVLTGNVEAFDVNMDTGLVTITARKQVNINLSLYNAAGKLVDGPTNFSRSDNTDEGMGVMHSTNIDKLFNETLRPVIKRAVDRMETKVALEKVNVTLTLNGQTFTHSYAVASL